MSSLRKNILSLLALLVFGAIPASAALTSEDLLTYWTEHSDLGVLSNGGSLEPALRNAAIELLAKAVPDECFKGIPPMAPPLPPNPALPCDGNGIPKVNQAYVWGLTEANGQLWFGTAANVHALVLGGYLGITTPMQTESFVAEFGHSYVAQVFGLPDIIGDWRPPRIFRYNPVTGQNQARDTPADLPLADLQRLRTTLGLRSAGSWPGSTNSPVSLAFLAGPALAAGGLNMFAYDAQTEVLVGSTNFPAYNNIRKWTFHDGALYTAVGKTAGGGAVLRWQDDPATPGWPWAFEEIGELNGTGVELAVHDGRLFVSTWPGADQAIAAIWMSPVIPPEGLRVTDASNWQRVWQATDYETDPVTAATYGAGALASFEGALYWGTMHVPGLGLAAHSQVHGTPDDQEAQITAVLGSHRAISIFRCADFGSGSPPAVQLLYGEQQLPVYVPAAGGWVLAPNAMGGVAPLFGHAGLGNPFNNYTWTLDCFQNELYLGTMDFSYLVFDLLPNFLSPLEELQLQLYLSINNIDPESFFGADLFCFDTADSAARAISRQGVGNPSTYGIRTMVSTPDRLYLGMANPMNLLTDTTPGSPQGGWELLSLTRRAPPTSNDFDGDGASDIGVYYPPLGKWHVFSSTDGFYEDQFGHDGTKPITGDFDGDGKCDFGVYDAPLGKWSIFASTAGFYENQFGYTGTIPITGDFDGDGKCDFGCYHPPSGNWYLFQTTDGFYQTQFGLDGTIPVTGDFDGDGLCDYGYYHPQTGAWKLSKSTGGFIDIVFGFANTVPVTGDFDADGTDDFGVYYDQRGKWYIFKSTLGYYEGQFGFAGTVPVVGDFDGDGQSDIGCYFAPGGNWYIFGSVSGFYQGQFGYAGTIPLGTFQTSPQ